MDIEKTMEFILEQQASFAASLQRLTERQEATSAAIDRLTERQEVTNEQVIVVTDHVGIIAKGMLDLMAAQRATDERLNALISVVDRLLPPLQ